MEVIRFSCFAPLTTHAAAWDRLAAGVPFRSWTWLSTWWRHYGDLGDLYVLGVFDGNRLVGIAPWYRTGTPLHGRTLRLLGDAEVCTEYAAILHEPGREHAVARSIADWLLRTGQTDGWDTIELTTTASDGSLPSTLADRMRQCGCRLHARTGGGCWRAPFPPTWEAYMQSLSKDRRKKIRRIQRRYLDGGKAVLHTARNSEQLDVARTILVDLHQRRRQMLGQSGCFASRRYSDFQADVLPQLLAESRLGLHWVELEGRPIAVEYHLLGNRMVYCYQGGIAPEAAAVSPGQIAMLLTFRQAIESGYEGFDFLRGNEPYKQQWRARFHPSVELRIVAGRPLTQLRHGIWAAGLDVKDWVKEAMGVVGLR
ncbi:MAG: GNAT family N-acetyltransferase [Thermoguttaceae bacterium]